MTIRNLDKLFEPKSIAVFGASETDGSVGRIVMKNLIDAGFPGEIYPVNPKYSTVMGHDCAPSTQKLPTAPDLAVIMTPSQTVPDIIAELGEKGTRAAVVLTAGITDANGLRQKMLDAAKPNLFRIMGPNVLGLMLPHQRINASFSHVNAQPGELALLSQSGSMVTSIVDWAANKHIGFSALMSLGDMADIDVADCLDVLATDRQTRAILMYLESIPHPRKFLSAARAASRMKPVIAIKSGRHEDAAKAAATHTGALAGMDGAVDAALRRAGVLRVKTLEELFDAAEITSRFKPIENSRLAIITNGGGAAVLAVDRLGDMGGHLAELSPKTIARLDDQLPATWSKGNPVDIIGDAPAKRFTDALLTVANDPNCDVILVMNCPTGLADPIDAARAVAKLVENGRIGGKPVLACWLGEYLASQARSILQEAGVASFGSPSDAITSLDLMTRWSKAQAELSRVPQRRSEDVKGQRAKVSEILAGAADENRPILTELEAKNVIEAYGIPVPATVIAKDLNDVEEIAGRMLAEHDKLVVKLYSKTVSHKSDIGGVILNLSTQIEARAAAYGIEQRFSKHYPGEKLDGFAVQPMIQRKRAREVIIGLSNDPVFGPVLMFGTGGTAVELVRDTAMALPPLDSVLSRDLIAETRIGRLLEGYRDVPAADIDGLVDALNGMSQLVVDFPAIRAFDINPLLVNEEGIIALDARVEIKPDQVNEGGPNRELPIRPYPSEWERKFTDNEGRVYNARPIKPVDIELYPEFFEHVSAEDIFMRFLSKTRKFSQATLKRLTQIDYEREMAFVAIESDSGNLAGVSRLVIDPGYTYAEFSLLVRTDMQGHGLGHELMRLLIEYAGSCGLQYLEGYVLSENNKMRDLCRHLGFKIELYPEDMTLSLATLHLGDDTHQGV